MPYLGIAETLTAESHHAHLSDARKHTVCLTGDTRLRNPQRLSTVKIVASYEYINRRTVPVGKHNVSYVFTERFCVYGIVGFHEVGKGIQRNRDVLLLLLTRNKRTSQSYKKQYLLYVSQCYLLMTILRTTLPTCTI